MNEIARIMRTDFDTWRGEERPSAAFAPMRYLGKMKSILELPVTPWNDPGSVSGEIDTDAPRTNVRKETSTMSTVLDDMFNLDTTLDPNASNNDRPALGRGAYALLRYFVKETTKAGNILVGDLICVNPPAGTTMKRGDACSIAWFTSKVGLPGKYEKARAGEFVRALLGRPDSETNMGPFSKKLIEEKQPGTGVCLIINASQNGQYTNFKYEHIPGQVAEKIAAVRQWLKSLDYAPAAAAPAPAPAPTPAPAAAAPSVMDALGFGGAPAAAPASNDLFGGGDPF